mmetsp:Transcript_28550/g.50736  ORF Transcript_28550/g.50736 Transcript_28550/m.50736 type:complete len:457 (+) Transcript_28550:782-2152(+)
MAKADYLLSGLFLPMILIIGYRFGPPVVRVFQQSDTASISRSSGRYDFAEIETGAAVMGSSDGLKGAKHFLQNRLDKYLLVQCQAAEKWVELSLSEDIYMDAFSFRSLENYASRFKDIAVYGTRTYPAVSWELVGKFTLSPTESVQSFKVKPVWVRFLKVVFESHYEDEYYCTANKLAVYGHTLLQTFQDGSKSFADEYSHEKQHILKQFDSLFNESEEASPSVSKRTEELNRINRVLKKLNDLETQPLPQKEMEITPLPSAYEVLSAHEVETKETAPFNEFFATLTDQLVKSELQQHMTSHFISAFEELAIQSEIMFEKLDQELVRLDASQIYTRSRTEHRLEQQKSFIETLSLELTRHREELERLTNLTTRLQSELMSLQQQSQTQSATIEHQSLQIFTLSIAFTLSFLVTTLCFLLHSPPKRADTWESYEATTPSSDPERRKRQKKKRLTFHS